MSLRPGRQMADNGLETYGGSVSAEIIQFPAQPKSRIVRRKSAPQAAVIDFGSHQAERERQISVAKMAATIRSTLAEADRLAGIPRVDRAYNEAAW
jgi:hypothetical protein